MKILHVASEVAPYSKTGGLADVLGALPRALADLGHEVAVVTPRYRSIDPERFGLARRLRGLAAPLGHDTVGVGVYEGQSPSTPRVRVYLIDHPPSFDRDGIYGDANGDFADNARRYALLGSAALALAAELAGWPDVVHGHDWQAGPALLYAKRRWGNLPLPKTVFTIHNLAFQGLFPAGVIHELGLPRESFHPDGYEIWGPAKDVHLTQSYSAEALAGKQACKAALQRELGLPVRADVPLCGSISRLTDQKGFDLVLEALPRLLEEEELQYVVLGSGERDLERRFRELAARHPKKLAVRIGYDEALAHRIEAGAELYLMPSRFEPCGLNQMYSLRYGTPPIVRATGGLDDTIVDFDARSSSGTGFKFGPYEPAALDAAWRRALAAWRNSDSFVALERRCMAQDFSWSRAARAYARLYSSLRSSHLL
jgi:starch synthase